MDVHVWTIPGQKVYYSDKCNVCSYCQWHWLRLSGRLGKVLGLHLEHIKSIFLNI